MTEQRNTQIRTGHCPNCGEDWRTHDYSCKDNIPEQPNTELLIVKMIQSLISAANRELSKLDELSMGSTKRKVLIRQASEDMDRFEKTTLYDLQKEFE